MSGEPVTKITCKKKLVFLFRAPKEENDQFIFKLKESGFEAVNIPVLSFNFINIDVLLDSIRHLTQCTAIIFTSTKAVEAVGLAISWLEPSSMIDLCNIMCYVVGKSTADAARKLGFNPKGEESGNASELMNIILIDVSESKKNILYPCANVRRDIISDVMKKNNIPLKEIIVYETSGNVNLEQIVLDAIKIQGFPEFVVFFSPSGVKYTLPLITKKMLPLHQSKVVAIGPTTENDLLKHSFTLYGVAEKPDPLSLVTVLQK